MYGREKLKTYTSCELYDAKSDAFKVGEVFLKEEADSVMDAMEQRIKELEEENKHLEDYIDAYQKSEAINIAKLDEKDKRIKELEADAELDQKKRLMLCNGYNRKCERVKELEAQCTKYQAEPMNNDPALNPTISKTETTTPKWVSVKDRLPKGNPMIPALDEDCKVVWWGNWHDDNLDIYGITHWLDNALPPPPTTEEK